MGTYKDFSSWSYGLKFYRARYSVGVNCADESSARVDIAPTYEFLAKNRQQAESRAKKHRKELSRRLSDFGMVTLDSLVRIPFKRS